jgi:hypothetical protein
LGSAKPPPSPVTPKVPPQLVACGPRDFFRIGQGSLETFEIAAELPPPQIRGSRIAQKTNDLAMSDPLNLVSLPKRYVIVIAKDGVFRYEIGQKQLDPFPPIDAAGPLFAWTDPARVNTFFVHALGSGKLGEYTLTGPSRGDAKAKPAPPQAARETVELAQFDARLFALQADGTPLYSTPKGLVRRGHESEPLPFPEPSGPAVTLFADASPERYWASDASGRLALFDPKQGAAPAFTASVPGVVLDAAIDGQRVLVLSMALDAHSYRPALTVFADGKQQAHLRIGPLMTRTVPELDFCPIPGRPWVVVATRRWMQLIDWETRRLLAEW